MDCRSAIARSLAITLGIVVIGSLVFLPRPPTTAVAASAPSSESRQDHSRLTTARPHFITKPHSVPRLDLTPAEIAGILDGITAGAPGDVLIVDCDGGFDFDAIQPAIDAAQDGDTIVVLPNNCNEQGQYFENLYIYEDKSLTIQSLMPENPQIVDATVVNGNQKDRVIKIQIQDSVDLVLDGLTLTNGRGGIKCWDGSNPTIRNCNITGNTEAVTGGGLFLGDGYGNPPSGPTILNCRITNNSTEPVGSRATQSAPLTGGLGGGIYVRHSATIKNCLIAGNTTRRRGAGLFLFNYSGDGTVVENCTIVNNICTDGDSTGGGIYIETNFETPSFIRSTILWNNFAPDGPQLFFRRWSPNDGMPTILYSDIEGGQNAMGGSVVAWGVGNMIVDPLFVDPDAGDYRLSPSSQCIDAGDPNTELDPADIDIEGEPRLQHCGIDIGADESADPLDCDGNEVADSCEIQDGTANDENGNGRPDECETEVYVDCNNCPGPGSGTVEDPYCSVQAGIDASWHGDAVILMPSANCAAGAYLENINFFGRNITVRSSQPDDPDIVADTIIDGSAGDSSVVAIHHLEGSGAVLDGLTITGGSGFSVDLLEDGLDVPIRAGGGVYCDNASPVIRRSVISGNQAVYGGGIMAVRSEARIEDCRVFDNLVIAQPEPDYFFGGYVAAGGGIHLRGGAPTIQRCLISNNIAIAGHPDLPEFRGTAAGAGVNLSTRDALDGSEEPIAATISNCQIRDNHILVTNPDFYWAVGGGLTAFLLNGSHLDLINCEAQDNSAPDLGGIYIQDGPAQLRGCTVSGNNATYGPTGGLELSSNGSTIVNSIIHDNLPADFDDSSTPAEISFSNIGTDDGLPVEGPGNINEDPLFIDAPAGNYHLLPGSPSRDTGDPEYVPDSEEADIDGDPRVLEQRVDMGADEFDSDCNENEVPDEQDILDKTSQDCNANGIPDECAILEFDCNANGVPDDCDITDGTSPDCNGNAIPDECDTDCNDNGVPDDCDIDEGTSEDCNKNGIPDDCDPDCNDNAIADDCDIDTGTSEDCNTNDVPDECDIAEGMSADCNDNGSPDECDVSSIFVANSPELSPVGWGSTQVFLVYDPPLATGEVTLAFTAYADLGADDEFLDVRINGVEVGSVFVSNASNCFGKPDADMITMTADDFNDRINYGDALIRMYPTVPVDPEQCDPPSFVTVRVEYVGLVFDCDGNGIPNECEPDCNENDIPDPCELPPFGELEDCNNNGIPDVCDLADGESDDCNENAIPDVCDISSGDSADDNGNGIPDECECPADFDDDGTVGAFDLAILLGNWGPNPNHPADLNHDDIINAPDLALLLGTWGPC